MRQSSKLILYASLTSLGIHLLLSLLWHLVYQPSQAVAGSPPLTVEVVHAPAVEPPNPPPPRPAEAIKSRAPLPPPPPPPQPPLPALSATVPQPGALSQRDPSQRSPDESPTAPAGLQTAAAPTIAFKQPGFMHSDPGRAARDAPLSRLPQVLQEQRIPYPEQARQLGIEGTVRARLLIARDGSVRQVEVLSGPGFGLNAAAARALQRFRFQPALDAQGGRRAHWISYGYTFRLED